jgi:hypothetical protein
MSHRAPAVLALALALGFAAAAGVASPANAAKSWSIQAAPPALTVGVATDVTLTVTPGNRDIKCLTVLVPRDFTVLRVSVVSAPGGTWAASKTGNGPTLATFATSRNQDRLKNGNAKFVIRVIATRSPLPPWTSAAYGDSPPCTQPLGPPGPPLPPFGLPHPTPTRVTPTPRPVPSTLPPRAAAVPTDMATPSAAPQPSPSGSTTPSAAPQPSPSGSTGGGVGPGGPGGATTSGGDGTSLDVGALPAGGNVQIDISAMGAIGAFAWVVPGLFLSLPGLLLVLIVLAQAGFATAFIPIIGRVFGKGRGSRALGRPMSSG